jgi:hypothetical protein
MRAGLLGRCAVTWLVLALMVLAAGPAWGEAGSMGPEDWQYQALDELAQAGLLSGHPKGPMSEWAGDELTRYEAASLTLRGVQGLGAAYEAQGRTLQEIAEAPSTGTSAQPALAAVTIADVARVEKLIEEFRAELVTMGVRVDDLGTALEDVQERVGKVEAEQRRHKLDGYVQFQYRDDNAPDGKQEFLVRRTRVNVRGPVAERTSYRVEFQLDAKESGKGRGSKVQMRTAYADYELNSGTLRIGQAKVPWGYELGVSSAALWTSERALFMDRLFPNQRDIGVQWSHRKSATAPQFDVGIFNGTGINASDNNDRKNLMARVDMPVKNGSVALSGYVGETGEGVSATDQNRYGASARFKWPCGTEFLGEVVTGQDGGNDVRGWYAQVGHSLSDEQPDLLFVKYDRYDENCDAPDDLFRRWCLGYWREINPATRLTLVHELRHLQAGFSELGKWDGNATYVQFQVRY